VVRIFIIQANFYDLNEQEAIRVREIHIEVAEISIYIQKLITVHRSISNINKQDSKTYFKEIPELT